MHQSLRPTVARLSWTIVILTLVWQAQAAGGIITAGNFSTCELGTASIDISEFSFAFSKVDKHLIFSMKGRSDRLANVEALISINAYGIDAYSKNIDPCSRQYNISSLCPVQPGHFAAKGNVIIPQKILNEVPALAFRIPDLQGFVTLTLTEMKGQILSCIRAPVSNGQSLASPTVQAVAGSLAASALVVSGFVSVAATVSASASSGIGVTSVSSSAPMLNTSPNIGDVFLWFQSISLNGAFSVAYPVIVHSFYKNFGWSVGLIQWHSMQKSIDSFRQRTGGNLTTASISVLDSSSLSLTSSSGSSSTRGGHGKRSTGVDYDSLPSMHAQSKITRYVSGLDAFAEQLRIPSQNSFMTVLLIFMLIEASLVVGSILIKLILDTVSRSHKLPKMFEEFRQDFRSSMTTLLLRSVLVIYGTWCMFCLKQLSHGDSWAANLLAGISLTLFNGIIVFLAAKVIHIALHTELHGEKGRDLLFQHKPYLRRYGVLYDQFRTWWFFIPCILYSIAKAMIIALGSNHGLFQVIACIILESFLLILLCWTQAYDSRQANAVNIAISIVRLISLVGTLIFIDILAFTQTTKTIAGIVVLVVQVGMTGVLVILIICNAVLPLLRKKTSREANAVLHFRSLSNNKDGALVPIIARDSTHQTECQTSPYSALPRSDSRASSENSMCPHIMSAEQDKLECSRKAAKDSCANEATMDQPLLSRAAQ